MPLPMAKPTTSATATIPAGSALSNAVDLSSGTVQMMVMPDAWTPGYITFEVSPDNVKYGALFDNAGNEVSRAVMPGAAVMLPPDVTAAALWLKIRSGSHANPIVQEADRVFVLSIG